VLQAFAHLFSRGTGKLPSALLRTGDVRRILQTQHSSPAQMHLPVEAATSSSSTTSPFMWRRLYREPSVDDG
jgi:hypothetical protein